MVVKKFTTCLNGDHYVNETRRTAHRKSEHVGRCLPPLQITCPVKLEAGELRHIRLSLRNDISKSLFDNIPRL